MTTLALQSDPLWSWAWLIFGVAFRKFLINPLKAHVWINTNAKPERSSTTGRTWYERDISSE